MPLSANYTFVGNGNWSLDGVGGGATGGGPVSVVVPAGSHVEAAFLYASTNAISADPSTTLSIGMNSLGVSFTQIGTVPEPNLASYRADVTSFVSEAIGDGNANEFTFNVASPSAGSSVDGYELAVVYSNPAESLRTISFLDGASQPGGDSFSLNFATPVNTAQAGFESLFSLGIGFSFQGTVQYSTVDVNGRRLTTSAGGQDDGIAANGGLITVGGLGDNPSNPADPNATPTETRSDDELYNLAAGNVADPTPYLANGATAITVNTTNPSNDDIIFFAGFNITDRVSISSGGNDAPVAVSDSGMGFTTTPSAAFTTASVLGNDFDPNGDAITLVSVDTTGLVGTLVNNGDGTFGYDPSGQFDSLAPGSSATTSFRYTIQDPSGRTASATATIEIDRPADGGGSGDVHFRTFDGLRFDLQSGGEFLIAQAVGGEAFSVQGRADAFGGVSVLSEVGIAAGGHRITVDAGRPDALHVDGMAIDLAVGAHLALGGGVELDSIQAGTWEVSDAAGDTALVVMHHGYLDIDVQPAPGRSVGTEGGAFVGLLGDFDGNPGNDIAARDGTVLATSADPSVIHGAFADAWTLGAGESILDPHQGMTLADRASLFGTVLGTVEASDPSGPAVDVAMLYEGLLGRAPDAAGFDASMHGLASGMTLADVAAGIVGSAEFGAAALDDGAFVTRLYAEVLNRPADQGGYESWVDSLANGAARGDVALGFALSGEHVAQATSSIPAGTFVPDVSATDAARLYYGVLDRAPDASGLVYFTDALHHGASAATMAGALLGSTEGSGLSGLSDADFVQHLYQGSLGRAAETSAVASWTAAMSAGETRVEVAVGIAESAEAHAHHLGQIEAGWQLA